jgi:hypothetical protein
MESPMHLIDYPLTDQLIDWFIEYYKKARLSRQDISNPAPFSILSISAY